MIEAILLGPNSSGKHWLSELCYFQGGLLSSQSIYRIWGESSSTNSLSLSKNLALPGCWGEKVAEIQLSKASGCVLIRHSVIQYPPLTPSVAPWYLSALSYPSFLSFLGSDLGVLGKGYSFVLGMLPGVGPPRRSF